jgi:hypothetical protein
MLDPQLERIGVGYARLADGMLMAALRFENATLRRAGWPVAYPADNQTDVPLEYGTEFPKQRRLANSASSASSQSSRSQHSMHTLSRSMRPGKANRVAGHGVSQLYHAVAGAINVASLVHGTVAHGGTARRFSFNSRRGKGATTRCCR